MDDEIRMTNDESSTLDWALKNVDSEDRLIKEFKFDDFKQAMVFADKVGDLAEANNHHPLMHVTWGRVAVEWWSHDAGGVTERDREMAAKTDELA